MLLGVVTAAVIPALVAGLVAEWRSRKAEVGTAQRDAKLRRLTQTRQLYLSNLAWFVDQLGAISGPMFEHTYGDINLVGDQEVLQQVAHLVYRVLLVRGSGPMNASEEER